MAARASKASKAEKALPKVWIVIWEDMFMIHTDDQPPSVEALQDFFGFGFINGGDWTIYEAKKIKTPRVVTTLVYEE